MTDRRLAPDGASREIGRRDRVDRLDAQFAERGTRADVWRALDLVLPTDEYLNVGYSRAWQTHLVGSPQQRLVERVVSELSSLDPRWHERRVLDLGCGRGGATRYVAERHGVDAVGVDLVSDNVALAQAAASTDDNREGNRPSFTVGDATRLPFGRDAFGACLSLDAIVYEPEKRRLFCELARVLEPRGVCVVSDLLVARGIVDDRALDRFRTAWGMPRLWTRHAYREAIEAADLAAPLITDISAHSVRRFRTWTRRFLAVADGPLGRALERTLVHRGLDPETVIEQVRAAHDALPALRHVLVPIYGTEE
ncbi:class I SAM-dependent methyltransferase [Halovivax cerinus]|uniref:Class I SAM-dependent methyltransferase n=1 Tax=Halovivax cerinus TaxID=1487865 RepID=A0ABD5NTP1_9EURY|nr:class I SAM-dependent methyltransferase [Halovivax cerinus]